MADSACPREEVEAREQEILSPHATFSSDERATRREHDLQKCPFRTDFQRDYTRIIHSRPFRRLRHKTQVFIAPQNDHICTRIEHHLHVASVAATIAQAVGLNVDLVRAIAIGHDLGHAPFGHKGERSLDKIVKQHGLSFTHELHSLRMVDVLESPYLPKHRGLNLTFAVRDGIACHCGERFDERLSPDLEKTPEALLTMERGAPPATLEGCVVRWADKIAYLGRDFEDAITLNIVNREELPNTVKRVLGSSNREMINCLIRELVQNGVNGNTLFVSGEVCEAIDKLYEFNMARIYRSEEAEKTSKQVDRSMEIMFRLLMESLDSADKDLNKIASRDEAENQSSCWGVFRSFLEKDLQDWVAASHARIVLDFLAGMTDSFFCKACAECFLPKSAV